MNRPATRVCRMISCLPSIALLAFAAASAAEEPVDWKTASSDPYALAALLGHDSWEVREKASDLLLAAGDPALPALAQALKSRDPEIRWRAASIIEKICSRSSAAGFSLVAPSRSGEATLWSSKRALVRVPDGSLFAAVLHEEGVMVWKSTDRGASWSRLPPPSVTGIDCKGFSLATDSKGAVTLAFHGSPDEMMHCRTFIDGEWGDPEQLSEFPVSGGRSIVICHDGSDRLHAAWQDSSGLTFYRSRSTEGWGITEAVGGLGAQTSLAVDGQGTVHVVGGYTCGLKYRRREAERWGAIETIDGCPNARHASVVLDAAGSPHVVWVSDGYEEGWRIYHSRRREDYWTERTLVSPPGRDPSKDAWHNPSAAMDRSGVLWVLFDLDSPDGRARLFCAAWREGSFGRPFEIPGGESGLKNPQVRWSACPACNNVADSSDLDFLAMSPAPPEHEVMFRGGISGKK